jgi:uncharacterized protein (TIGR03067 family)
MAKWPNQAPREKEKHMIFQHWLALPVLMLFVSVGEDAGERDLKLLQGSWTLAALEVNGKDVPADKLEGTVLTVKGKDYKVTLKNKNVTVCVIQLDPKQNPKHLDMIFLDGANKDKVHKGIYRIDGDKFQLARGLTPDQARPKEFATWPDTNYFVATWKRIGK